MSETCETSNKLEDQKASNAAVPASTDAHKNPDMKPVAGKMFGTGANIK